jgi:molybdate transport system regulatory protein
MKTSARNSFHGTVHAIRSGAVNDEVVLDAGHGVHVVATVTHESTVALGLKPGVPAFALIKASSIVLMTDLDGVKLSTRNQLAAKIATVTTGAVNSEVVLDLPGGGQIVTIITNDSAASLALRAGSAATAVFKAGSVIVGVKT